MTVQSTSTGQPTAQGIPTPQGSSNTKPTRVRWTIFGIIFILVVINLIDRVSLSIGMPTIAKEFNLSPTMQGLILSSFFWAYALLQIPGGWLIDKFGARKIITGSTVFWGVFQTLAAFSTGGMSLLFTRMALGAAEAPLFPAGGKMISSWLSSQERGRGAVLMDCGGPLGAALGGIIIAYMIVSLDSWRMVFAIAGIVTVLLGALAWYYLRDNPLEHPKVNQGELDQIFDEKTRAADKLESSEPAPKGLGIPLNSLTGILLGRAAWAMAWFGLLTWGPSYLSHARNFDLHTIGNATFIIFMSGALGSLCGGFLFDLLVKRGVRHIVALKSLLSFSGLVTLVSFVSLPYLSDPVMAVAVLSVASFFLLWGSIYWSFPALLAPKSRVGVVGGTMNMAGSTGGILVPILVGLIVETTGGYNGVLAFFAGCAGFYVLGTCLIGAKSIKNT